MTDLSRYEKAKEKNYYKKLGKVLNVVGLTIESAGPDARLAMSSASLLVRIFVIFIPKETTGRELWLK